MLYAMLKFFVSFLFVEQLLNVNQVIYVHVLKIMHIFFCNKL